MWTIKLILYVLNMLLTLMNDKSYKAPKAMKLTTCHNYIAL
jgi:hypothetical protein